MKLRYFILIFLLAATAAWAYSAHQDDQEVQVFKQELMQNRPTY